MPLPTINYQPPKQETNDDAEFNKLMSTLQGQADRAREKRNVKALVKKNKLFEGFDEKDYPQGYAEYANILRSLKGMPSTDTTNQTESIASQRVGQLTGKANSPFQTPTGKVTATDVNILEDAEKRNQTKEIQDTYLKMWETGNTKIQLTPEQRQHYKALSSIKESKQFLEDITEGNLKKIDQDIQDSYSTSLLANKKYLPAQYLGIKDFSTLPKQELKKIYEKTNRNKSVGEYKDSNSLYIPEKYKNQTDFTPDQFVKLKKETNVIKDVYELQNFAERNIYSGYDATTIEDYVERLKDGDANAKHEFVSYIQETIDDGIEYKLNKETGKKDQIIDYDSAKAMIRMVASTIGGDNATKLLTKVNKAEADSLDRQYRLEGFKQELMDRNEDSDEDAIIAEYFDEIIADPSKKVRPTEMAHRLKFDSVRDLAKYLGVHSPNAKAQDDVKAILSVIKDY